MYWKSVIPALLAGSVQAGSLRFSCSQLVVERLDPLVNPGQLQAPHLHQIVSKTVKGRPKYGRLTGADWWQLVQRFNGPVHRTCRSIYVYNMHSE